MKPQGNDLQMAAACTEFPKQEVLKEKISFHAGIRCQLTNVNKK